MEGQERGVGLEALGSLTERLEFPEGVFLELQVRLDVVMGGLEALVAEPQRDGRHEVGLPAAVEAHAAMAPVEERHVEVLLQRPDAVGDGRRGDAELLGGAGEALVAGRGLEEAQAVERGQEQQR